MGRWDRSGGMPRAGGAMVAAGTAGTLLVITGAKKVDKQLALLDRKAQRATIQKGCRVAAKIVADRMRALAPVRTGALKAAIRVRAMKRSRKGFGVNAIVGKGWFQGETFYAGFMEWGAPKHRYFGRGISPLKGVEYMTRAYDETKGQARDELISTLLEGIKKVRSAG